MSVIRASGIQIQIAAHMESCILLRARVLCSRIEQFKSALEWKIYHICQIDAESKNSVFIQILEIGRASCRERV